MKMNTLQDFNINRWLRSTSGHIFLIFLVIAAFYLITEHTAHVFGALPYVLLLLCPLLHLFMHGGHGDHAGHSSQSQRDGQSDSPQNQRDSGSDHPRGHVH
jgi:hypothetical protein